MAVKPIPEGFHTITPHLVVKDAANAIEFYKKAFSASEVWRSLGPGGKSIMHAELKIGDSIFMLNDEFPEMNSLSPASIGNTAVTISLYVEDADKVFNQAVESGAKVVMPLADMFWGDRYGMLTDPYGHRWAVCTHIKDCTPEEIAAGMQQACSEKAPQH
jgi:PhnB protein